MTQNNDNPQILDGWKRYNVVQGVLIYNERVLLVGNDYGYTSLVWSLPGGRLEPGEQHPMALEREFLEETGLQVVPGEMLYVVDSRSLKDRKHFVTCVFAVRLATETEDEPQVSCASDVAVKQVRFVPFAEAAPLLRSPSLGEPLVNYLYYGLERLPRRYWRYPEYLRTDWQTLSWPPGEIQAE
jgi:ADP-ribose pyrophosphatase YjhB (NUDIX family)